MAFEVKPIKIVTPPAPEPEPQQGDRDFDYNAIFGEAAETNDDGLPMPGTTSNQEPAQQEPPAQEPSTDGLAEQMAQLTNVISQMQQQQAKILQTQQDFDSALTEPYEESEPEPEIDEYNLADTVKSQRSEISDLKGKLDTLQKYVQNFQQNTETTRANDVQESIEKAVNAVDQEMSKDGYEGFANDGRFFIDRTIKQLMAQGKEKQAHELYHSPQRWGEVWKRKVDQDMANALKKREGLKTNKQQAKSGGQLIGTPGSNPGSSENDDEDTVNVWENYAKIRGVN